jgi:hypothetical protein
MKTHYAKHVHRILDKYYERVIQHSSANWGGNNVWKVTTTSDTDGIFVFETDEHDFSLIHRTEDNEETDVTLLEVYTIGSGEIKSLIYKHPIQHNLLYVWTLLTKDEEFLATDELNDLVDFLESMGIELDHDYLLKATPVEQCKYYLEIFRGYESIH